MGYIKKFIRKTILPFAGLTALVNTGCQSFQIDGMKNPDNCGAFTREVRNTQNCIDARLGRTFDSNAKKLGDNVGRVPGDVAAIFDDALGYTGLMIFRGYAWGYKFHEGIFSNNPENLNYNRKDLPSGKNKIGQILFSPVKNSVDLIADVFSLSGHLKNSAVHLINLVAREPVIVNTNAREQFFLDSKGNNPSNDTMKLVYDGISTPYTGTLGLIEYTLTNEGCLIPDSWKLGYWNGLKSMYNVEEKQVSALERKMLSDDKKRLSNGKLISNSVPIVASTLHNIAYGDTYNSDLTRKKATSIVDGIETSIKDDSIWYANLNGNEDQAPGIIENGKIYPHQSLTLDILTTLYSGISMFFQSSGGSGGSSVGGSFGGGGNGGGSLGGK